MVVEKAQEQIEVGGGVKQLNPTDKENEKEI
jgi:hypothetical protein